ncbi:hypothetical protein PIB30_097374 [Stylosanthes scabra]|uniref:Uncharacterized protein n=1 Tax=Stylosanthes scabra TaxID=79078 RepID=A0ABU6YV41_9FABA|nr:hypothetical protein [Stylosanthes scabra]
MPYELYKFLKLGPLKKTKEIFTTADASIVPVVGIPENILVRIGELVIPADFHVIKSTKGEKVERPSTSRKAILENYGESKIKGRSSNEKGMRNSPTQSKGEKKKIPLNIEKKKKKKKKEPDEGSTQKKRALKCLTFD